MFPTFVPLCSIYFDLSLSSFPAFPALAKDSLYLSFSFSQCPELISLLILGQLKGFQYPSIKQS